MKLFTRLVAISGAALALSGCVEQLGDVRGSFAVPVTPLVTKVAVGAVSGANVALFSLEGAPEAALARFRTQFAAAASVQEITLTGVPQAHYVIRGYLSAYPAEGGTAFAYVWDVFDAKKQRSTRVADEIVVKTTPADPWSLADDAVLASLAGKSVDDLATFLAGTPEVRSAKAVLPSPATPPVTPLAYAPVE